MKVKCVFNSIVLVVLIQCFVASAIAFELNALGASANAVIVVANTNELEAAIQEANDDGQRTIALKPGLYSLKHTLNIRGIDITITSTTGKPADVVIEGDTMAADALVGNLLRVSGSGFTLDSVTLRKSRYHLLQIAGEENTDNVTVRHCIFQDAYQQMIKISGSTSSGGAADNGIIENNRFEYTSGIGPQFYIGGIDAHQANNWVVRNNIFINIASPEKTQAEHAIHFWSDSRNLTITHNWIINSDRGIGLGMGQRGASHAVVANNVIFHDNLEHPFADVGIAIENGQDILIANNTIYLAHDYPRSIEYRFFNTKNVRIINNATNKPIVARDNATAEVINNFSQLANTDISLGLGAKPVLHKNNELVKKGMPLQSISDDIFGNARNQQHPSIGAVEF